MSEIDESPYNPVPVYYGGKICRPGQIAPTFVADEQSTRYMAVSMALYQCRLLLWIGNVLMPIWIRIRPSIYFDVDPAPF
jgi:hypothetical protein